MDRNLRAGEYAASSGDRQLQRELAAVLRTAFVASANAVLGIEPVGNSPQEFGDQVRARPGALGEGRQSGERQAGVTARLF